MMLETGYSFCVKIAVYLVLVDVAEAGKITEILDKAFCLAETHVGCLYQQDKRLQMAFNLSD